MVSYPATNAAFFITNNTTETLIAFRNSLAPGNLIGGIPAWRSDHGIRRDTAVFTQTHAFQVVLITEEDYLENWNDLPALNTRPFARIFVLYNHGLPNPTRYTVSPRLGGNNPFIVTNMTNFDVELRLNGPDGDLIGFAPRQMVTRLYLTAGDARIFPVFRFWNPVTNTLATRSPRTFDGRAYGVLYQIGANQTEGMNMTDILNLVDNDMSLGGAWMLVDNQTGSGVTVESGTSPVTNQLGGTIIPHGSSATIDVRMLGINDNLDPERVISNYFVNVNGLRRPIVAVIDGTNNSTFTLKSDHRYTVRVTGRDHDGTLRAEIILQDGVPGAPHLITLADLQ
jgi:hypothetical protein